LSQESLSGIFFVFFTVIDKGFLFYAVNKILNFASSLSGFYVLALLFEKNTQLQFNLSRLKFKAPYS
jgi:hypothetical protein